MRGGGKMIRILIVDDHGVLRAGLAALLSAEAEMEVVGEAGSGRECMPLVKALKPDVVLMDINLPDTDGILLTRQVKKAFPETRVLMLTVHEDESLLKGALKGGASGYVIKRAVKAELINAIQAVMRGDLYVHPSMTRALLSSIGEDLHQAAGPAGNHGGIGQLTGREKDVLQLIAQGYTNAQIGKHLSISVRTVEYHRANLMAKLALTSRVELVRFAVDHGLVENGSNRQPGAHA